MAPVSRSTAAAAAAIVLALGVSACGVGPAPVPAATITPTASPSASGTAEPTEAPAVILSVAGLSVDEGDGTAAGATVVRDEPDAVIALLTQLFGQPTVDSDPYGVDYQWEGVSANVRGWVVVRFETATLAGYELRTSQGISVGASRADVLALDHTDDGYDGDGDGLPDAIGLEPVEEPGTESLLTPGAVGTSYVDAIFDGDTVAALVAPRGDWQDV